MVPAAHSMLRSWRQRFLDPVAQHPWTQRMAENPTLSRELVSRYVAGESVDDAVRVCRELASQHRLVSLTQFPALPLTRSDADAAASEAIETMRHVHEAQVEMSAPCEISIAWTALGGHVDADGMGARLRRLAEAARTYGCDLTLESEGDFLDQIVTTVMQVRMDIPQLGISVPASMRRSFNICRELAYSGSRVRLFKGTPGDGIHAYSSSHEVDLAYVRCLKVLLGSEGYPMLATQDPRLLRITKALAEHMGRPSDSYEYVMRWGVRPEQQAIIADRGDRMRTYVPFGQGWFPYVLSHLPTHPQAWSAAFAAAIGR